MGRRNKKGDRVHGWVNVDKPLGMTSTQVIGKIRRALNAQKVGHAGTLDPLASGVLPIAIGEATKTIPYIQDALKTYEFTVTWGQQRSTDDAEGDVVVSSDERPALSEIKAVLPDFVGKITQVPPQFSAVKIEGQRAYDLARSGEEVEIKQREVFVESLEILHSDEDCAAFSLTCGKGTYVRSIARDMGIELGCYGFVSALRRTAVGAFGVEDAILLDNLAEMDHIAAREAVLLPLQVALDDIPVLAVTEREASVLRNGQALSLMAKSDFHRLEDLEDGFEALALAGDDAIAIVARDKANVKPVRVFNF